MNEQELTEVVWKIQSLMANIELADGKRKRDIEALEKLGRYLDGVIDKVSQRLDNLTPWDDQGRRVSAIYPGRVEEVQEPKTSAEVSAFLQSEGLDPDGIAIRGKVFVKTVIRMMAAEKTVDELKTRLAKISQAVNSGANGPEGTPIEAEQ